MKKIVLMIISMNPCFAGEPRLVEEIAQQLEEQRPVERMNRFAYGAIGNIHNVRPAAAAGVFQQGVIVILAAQVALGHNNIPDIDRAQGKNPRRKPVEQKNQKRPKLRVNRINQPRRGY